MATAIVSTGNNMQTLPVDILNIFLSQSLKFEMYTLSECKDSLILFAVSILTLAWSGYSWSVLSTQGYQRMLDNRGLQADLVLYRECRYMPHALGALVILVKWGCNKWVDCCPQEKPASWWEWDVKGFCMPFWVVDWMWWGGCLVVLYVYGVCFVASTRDQQRYHLKVDRFVRIWLGKAGEALDEIMGLVLYFAKMLGFVWGWVRDGFNTADERDGWYYPHI